MRFAPIVKIRKQKLDSLENQMASVNFAINAKKEQIELALSQMNNTHPPTSGVIGQFAMHQSFIVAYKQELERFNLELDNLELQKSELTKQIKLAHMELEKMKYLANQEELEKLKKLRAIEAANLDEAGLILFNNRRANNA